MNGNLRSLANRILYLEKVEENVRMLRDIAEIRGDKDMVKMFEKEILIVSINSKDKQRDMK